VGDLDTEGSGGWKPPPEPEPKPDTVTSVPAGTALQGEVRGFHERTETRPSTNPFTPNQETHFLVWTFRLERYAEDGTRLEPIAVEMGGESFEGFINEGDTIALYEQWNGGLATPKRVYNITTATEVRVAKQWPIGQMIASGVALVFAVVVFGLILLWWSGRL